ncbi:MAG: RDD family protein [Synergistaceae bacterium]|jgi:uncharacterized RDD family membrane protein YckC|nr:RDD family protein [Synergistaceae bacterium]
MKLASRKRRFAAQFIDSFIYFTINRFLMLVLWIFQREEIYMSFASGFYVLLAFPIFFLLNYKFLRRGGQTIGKKILNIQISTMDNKVPPLYKLAAREMLFPIFQTLLLRIEAYFPGGQHWVSFFLIFDLLFIFRPDRRCIHDFFAGTHVTDASPVKSKKTSWWNEPMPESTETPANPVSLSRETADDDVFPFLMYKPATRRDRFFGYLIDKVAIFVGYVLIVYIFSQLKIQSLPQNTYIIYSECIMCCQFALSFLIFNAYFLISGQQTFGKVFLGMKIVGLDCTRVSFFKILFCRELLFWGPWSFIRTLDNVVPYIIPPYFFLLIINALFIFREDRRCLHDWACQTRVVYVP